MRFTLVYDGLLPAQNSGDGRVRAKHDIRCQLHNQLQQLWDSREPLRANLNAWRARRASGHIETEAIHALTPYVCGPFEFTPLVRSNLSLLCELDILFLRAEPPGSVFTANEAGDLDNRLKVLFDALRVPKDAAELPPGATPTADHNPFLCLLEDDKLITAVRLESERLLDVAPNKSHVRIVVRVKVKPQRANPFLLHFAND